MKIAVRFFLLLLTSFSLEARSKRFSQLLENRADRWTPSVAVLAVGTTVIAVGQEVGTASFTLIGSSPTQISGHAPWLHVTGTSTTRLQTFTDGAITGATRDGTIPFKDGASNSNHNAWSSTIYPPMARLLARRDGCFETSSTHWLPS